MCANYTPVTRADRLLQYFGVQRGRDEPDHDTFPMGLAPFIRLAPSNTNPGDIKPTYKDAWAAGQRCIIPSEAIYEPNYASGKPVRWRIRKANGEPVGIAGIYRSWTNAEGEVVFAMSMILRVLDVT